MSVISGWTRPIPIQWSLKKRLQYLKGVQACPFTKPNAWFYRCHRLLFRLVDWIWNRSIFLFFHRAQTWSTSTFIAFWCMTVIAASLEVFCPAILENETYFNNIFHPSHWFSHALTFRPKTNNGQKGGNGTRPLQKPCKMCAKHAWAPTPCGCTH